MIRPGVITLQDGLDRAQIQQVLDLKKTVEPAEADVISPYGGSVRETNTRQSKIWWLNASNARWLGLQIKALVEALNTTFFAADIDSLEPIQLTEYAAGAGGHCKAHIDSSYHDESVSSRKLSLTIQLTDGADYAGGDLRLYPDTLDAVTAPRDLGSLCLFRSHVIHEVTPVTRGSRTSLVAWFSGPDWR